LLQADEKISWRKTGGFTAKQRVDCFSFFLLEFETRSGDVLARMLQKLRPNSGCSLAIVNLTLPCLVRDD